MKHAVLVDGKKHVLNTDRDSRLYAAPRDTNVDSTAFRRGKDIYLYRPDGRTSYYYVHKWTLNPLEVESITLLPTRQAERFLGERGLECADMPGIRAYMTLRNWGYGILEEF